MSLILSLSESLLISSVTTSPPPSLCHQQSVVVTGLPRVISAHTGIVVTPRLSSNSYFSTCQIRRMLLLCWYCRTLSLNPHYNRVFCSFDIGFIFLYLFALCLPLFVWAQVFCQLLCTLYFTSFTPWNIWTLVLLYFISTFDAVVTPSCHRPVTLAFAAYSTRRLVHDLFSKSNASDLERSFYDLTWHL